MQFIKPKIIKGQNVEWLISERTRAIVKYYAKYTGRSEDEIVDRFLVNILDDLEFTAWIQSKMDNKQMMT